MFRFCPSCGSEKIQFEQNKRFYCPHCGFVYYHNTAAATGGIIRTTGERLLFLIRAKEPGKGKLDLPGGFVDPQDGAVEGLRRECKEELGFDPGMGFSFFASFPNTYPYKNILYNTCDLFFTITIPDLTEEDLHLEANEIEGLRFIKPEDVNLDEFAFDSARRAVKAYLTQLVGEPAGH
jgi:ADP-ribose pyrophosphatase YjhB (NUDIX family)